MRVERAVNRGVESALPQGPAVHVAIVRSVYAGLILRGLKTAELRLTRRRIPPWGVASAGDAVYLKVSGGGYVGVARVAGAEYAELVTPGDLDLFRGRVQHEVMADEAFWADRAGRRYASLIRLSGARPHGSGPDLSVLTPAARRSAWHTLAATHPMNGAPGERAGGTLLPWPVETPMNATTTNGPGVIGPGVIGPAPTASGATASGATARGRTRRS